MATFTWEGKTRDGASRSGTLAADNSEAVIAQLRGQDIMVTKVRAKAKNIEEYLTFLQPSVKTKDVVVFTRQLATMIDAGLPLVQCMDILGSQEENATFKRIINESRADVESGSTFSDALAKHPKAFDRLYVNLVAAGEVGGILDTRRSSARSRVRWSTRRRSP
jgi:type IV pilus assembly protein PilC